MFFYKLELQQAAFVFAIYAEQFEKKKFQAKFKAESLQH